jgi:hypothetical protein
MAPPRKPPTSAYYAPRDVELVRSACLTLASYLGTFIDDLVVVGGLVPTLLIEPSASREPHVGTKDLDLGLSLAVLEQSRYAALVAHLRSAGFEPDLNEAGKPANHRWKHQAEHVTVDFLMAPTRAETERTAQVRVIERDLSAVIASGLPLAFRDRKKVTLTGKTLRGERMSRELWVCGAGSFVVLKALAFRGRGENKDAYDLLYVLENFGSTYVLEVADALKPLLDTEAARRAVEILEADFVAGDRAGPTRAAAFLSRTENEAFKSDLAGAVLELLRALKQ